VSKDNITGYNAYTDFDATGNSTQTVSGTTPVQIPEDATATVYYKAFASKEGYVSTVIADASGSFSRAKVITPVITPGSTTITTGQGGWSSLAAVTITSATPGAVIYYSTEAAVASDDNANVTGAGATQYTKALNFSTGAVSPLTLNAIALKDGFIASTAATPAVYTVTP